MKTFLMLGIVLFVCPSVASAIDYKITILNHYPSSVSSRPANPTPKNLVGESIEAIVGEVSEVRIELDGVNMTGIERNKKKVEQTIRKRIYRAKCLGRKTEVFWHQAPWAHGDLLLKNGRILPIQILLSGIIVGDLLFTDMAEPEGAVHESSAHR